MAKKTIVIPKVYLETSFVSYLTGAVTSNAKIAADQAWTRKWWECERANCDVYASAYTLEESNKGLPEQIQRRMKVLSGVPQLYFDVKTVTSLAQKLLNGHALPEGETTDALHIAVASVSRMDILLTWNCRHMANPHTLLVTMRIVEKAGYRCPLIMTPKTFIENTFLEG